MGYERAHAIIVTGHDFPEQGVGHTPVALAHHRAHQVFADVGAHVTELSPLDLNSTRSFAVLPDGSKEGWDESDAADRAREAFVEWLNEQRYEDGTSPVKWAEVQFCDDAMVTWVRDSDGSYATTAPVTSGRPASSPGG